MLLKKVEIRNFRLSGKDIIWEILPDASILVGKNGTSKTTLLRMIAAALRKERKDTDIDLFLQNEYIRLYFEDENIIEIDGSGEDFSLCQEGFSVKSEFIETFDVPNKEGKSILNELLAQLTTDFLLFQSRLRKDIDALYTKKHKFSAEQIANIEKNIQINNERRERFEETVNFFFKDSDKVLQIEEDFSFLSENEINLPISALSSGEKQLLVILLKVFLQNEEPYLLLLDEPEISMHTYWQRELLSKIRIINPNCQLLVVTHSGTLLGRGWMQNFVRIEEITSSYNTKGIEEIPVLEYDGVKMKKLREEMEIVANHQIVLSQFKSIFKDITYFNYTEFVELLGIIKAYKLWRYRDESLKICLNKMSWSEIEKIFNNENSSNFANKYELVLEDEQISWMIRKAPTVKIAIEKLEALAYKFVLSPFSLCFNTLLNKAINKNEISDIEEFRNAYGMLPNSLYLKKLAFKNIPLKP